MISERARNSIVGLTMLAAMAAMMGGIFVIGSFPNLRAVKPYQVTLLAQDASGVNAGNRVFFNGVGIGVVTGVDLQPDLLGVRIYLNIDDWAKVPSNAVGYVVKPNFGSQFIKIAVPRGATAPRTGPAMAYLSKDSKAEIRAYLEDTGFIPQTSLERANTVLDRVNAALEKKTLAEFDKEDPQTRVANLSILLQRLERDAQGVDQLLGDPKMQQNIKQIVENVRAITDDLREKMKKIDGTMVKADAAIDQINKTAGQIGVAATQAGSTMETTRVELLKTTQRLAEVLASVQKSTDAIAAGKGTAGLLVNDPRLYEGLVDMSKSLKTTTDDLKVLVQKWTDEGLVLKLK